LNVENPDCEDRIRLSQALENANREVFEAKAFQDRALRENDDPRPYGEAVALAERAMREAVNTLEQHRKDHRC